MILETRAVPAFYKNGFVLGCERTHEGIVIDPGDEVEALLDAVEQHHLSIRYILLTHAHIDHVTGVGIAKRALGVPIVLHRADEFLYERAPEIGQMYGLQCETLPPVDEYFDGPGPWSFGDYDVFVHHTPGHCPGGVCLQVGKRGAPGTDLFVGDTLFAGSIGRTDLPGADHATLIRAIKEVLFPLGDDAIVYPGHGQPTTIGQERRTNPFLQ
jgi:glyoxylase-like metal-dependent hydrolase (beta-lactamase superfamily II)